MAKQTKHKFLIFLSLIILLLIPLKVNAREISAFDAKFYASTYPDVVNAVGTDENALLNHFITNGIKEGRFGSPSYEFQASYYYLNNPDVAQVTGTNPYLLLQHFLSFGKAEGRKGAKDAVTSTATPVVAIIDIPDTEFTNNLNGSHETLDYNLRLLERINTLRYNVGVGQLYISQELNNIANTRAVECSSLWSHTRPDGTQGTDMIDKSKWAGENLSMTGDTSYNESEKSQRNAADYIFDKLCKSQGHYDNMVRKEFKYIGIGTYTKDLRKDGYTYYTAYMFSS